MSSLLQNFPISGGKSISILRLSCRMSDLPFSFVLQSSCNKERKGVICNVTLSSNSSQSTRPTGPVLWEELLVLSRFHS